MTPVMSRLYRIAFVLEAYAKTNYCDAAGKPTVPEKGRRKAEKVVPLLDIDQLVSDPAFFTRPTRESVLNKSTLASWKASRFLLPQDWYGGSLDLGSFILSKERKVSCGKFWLYEAQSLNFSL